MPFKTKRQKLAAAQRRFTFNDAGTVSYDAAIEDKPKGSEKEFARPEVAKSKAIEDISYIKFDLLKILIGASVVIIAQVALSLTLH